MNKTQERTVTAHHINDISSIICDSGLLKSLWLTERERSVLTLMLKDRITTQEIADKYDLSPIRILQIKGKAIRCIKNRLPRLIDSITKIDELTEMNNKLTMQVIALTEYESKITGLSYDQEMMDSLIVNHDFSVRVINALHSEDIRTVRQLINQDKYKLLRIRNFGRNSLEEIEIFLHKYHLRFINEV